METVYLQVSDSEASFNPNFQNTLQGLRSLSSFPHYFPSPVSFISSEQYFLSTTLNFPPRKLKPTFYTVLVSIFPPFTGSFNLRNIFSRFFNNILKFKWQLTESIRCEIFFLKNVGTDCYWRSKEISKISYFLDGIDVFSLSLSGFLLDRHHGVKRPEDERGPNRSKVGSKGGAFPLISLPTFSSST